MNTPLLDKRNFNDIIEEMKKLVPNFVPEWNFDSENPDVGSALFMIFALQLDETKNLLNESLNKNFVSFLNMANINLKAPESARVPLVFTLTTDEDISVVVDKGTTVFSNETEQVSFETEETFQVTPAKISGCYFGNDNDDKLIYIDKENEEFRMFDYKYSNNIQKHEIYFVDNSLLNIKGYSDIVINFQYTEMTKRKSKIAHLISDVQFVAWEYYTQSGEWIRFDDVNFRDNKLILKKRSNIPVAQNDDFGGYVIRARLLENSITKFKEFSFDMLKMQSKLNKTKPYVTTDKLFLNDKKIPEESKYPFGNFYNLADRFYVGSNEVLSKKGSEINITMDIDFVENQNDKVENDINWKMIMKKSQFEGERYPIVSIKEVRWYYFNGYRWEPLKVDTSSSSAFYCDFTSDEMIELQNDLNDEKIKKDKKKNVKEIVQDSININIDIPKKTTIDKIEQPDAILGLEEEKEEQIDDNEVESKLVVRKNKKTTIRFQCPKDIEMIEVNGELDYFIVGEIYRIENYFLPNNVYMSPLIKDIKLKYDYKNQFKNTENFYIKNNNEIKDKFNDLVSTGTVIYPFQGLNIKGNSFYMCTDKPLKNGPINILFSLEKIEANIRTPMKIEYIKDEKGEKVWRRVQAYDGTKNLTQSGIVTFVGLNNIVKTKLFNKEGYWLRFIFEEEDKEIRKINGIYLNGVWALQQMTIEDEYIEMNDEIKEYALSSTPILDEEIWVNEIDNLNQIEIKDILYGDEEHKVVYNDQGIIDELWIKWKKKNHFINASSDERIYVLDKLTGIIKFGDNINGKRPPLEDYNKIKANYRVGGGKKGNVSKNTINTMNSSIAFIDKVFNPEAASGGTNAETINNAINRGRKLIRHKEKAISKNDIENIILGSFTNIYDVKCIPNCDSSFNKKRGHINIVIIPNDNIEKGTSFTIKKRIRKKISNNIPAVIGDKKLHISDPKIINVSIKVIVKANRKEDIYLIRNEIENKLNKFLDYVTGNYDGLGWKIGEIPRKSTIYGVLGNINGISGIEVLNVNYRISENFEEEEITVEKAEKIQNGVIVNGDHKIEVIY